MKIEACFCSSAGNSVLNGVLKAESRPSGSRPYRTNAAINGE